MRIPLVPTTGSTMIAATVFGPSSLQYLFGPRQHFFSRVRAFLNAMVEVGNAEDAGDARLRCPTARIASQRESARCSAVVRAIPCANLVTPGEHPRDADRVLVCLGAAVSEEEGIDVSGRNLRELHAQARAHVGGHERVGIGERRGLLLDCANHPLVAVSDVHAHQLAIEVDEALSFRRPEVDSLRARDGNRIHRGLCGPLEERVPAAEFDDLLA